MRKQDRQGVRRAMDIEQKYDLSQLSGLGQRVSQENAHTSALLQQLSQSITDLNNKIADLEYVGYPVGAVYISVNNTNPSELFGGTWELYTEGHLVLGMDADSELFKLSDTCYVWKRIS